MAIAFRSSAAASSDGTSQNVIINKPSGAAVGDVLIAFISIDVGSSTSLTTPSGWTLIRRTNNSTTIGQACYYRVVDGTEGTTFTFAGDTQQNALDGGILCYSGADNATVIDVSSNPGSTGSSASPSAASITTTNANDMLVVGWSINDNVAPTSGASGMTNRVNQHSSTSNAIYVSELLLSSSGATGSKSITYSASKAYATHQVAILPPTSVALSVEFDGVGTLTGGLGVPAQLSVTMAGVGTLTGGLAIPGALAVTMVGKGVLTSMLTTPTQSWLIARFDGVGRVMKQNLQAWIFPSSVAGGVAAEYSDGRIVDVLKPEYYTVLDNGTLSQLTVATDGVDAYSAANAASVKAHCTQAFVTISASNPGVVTLIASSTLRTNFINTLIPFVQSIGFAGLDIDFEAFYDDTWLANNTAYTNYKSFMTQLGNALHAVGLKLMLDGPPLASADDQTFYGNTWLWEDFNTIPVDYLVVMAYDYMFQTGSGNPVQPISWAKAVCEWMQARIWDWSRIVIGLPSYGYHGATGSFTITEDNYVTSAARTGFTTAVRDNASGEMHWTSGGTSNFFQDSTSMDTKRLAIINTGLYAISVWVLGGNKWFAFVPALSGTFNGVGTLTGTLGVPVSLSVAFTGQGTLTATLSSGAPSALSVTLTGKGTLTAGITTFSPTYDIFIGNPLARVFVIAGTVNVQTAIGRRSTASFVCKTTTATHFAQYTPVAIFVAGIKKFSGYVTVPKEQKPGLQNSLTHTISCVDQHFLADKRLAKVTYTNHTCGFIVNDLITTYLAAEGVTAGTISAGTTIPIAVFAYGTVAQALDALAAKSNFQWQIDQDKKLQFVSYTAIAGPTIDGTGIDYTKAPVTVQRQNADYRNTQYVLGGTAQTSSQTEARKGDGNTTAFTFSYPFSTVPTVTVNASSKTVGIKGVDTGKDWYWSKGDPVLAQDSGGVKLISTDTLSVTYLGQFPSVIQSTDDHQIQLQAAIDGTSGIIESVQTDSSIQTLSDGFTLASQLLMRYALPGTILQFTTMLSTFTQGQLCTVNLPMHGLTGVSMLVENVSSTDSLDGINLWYTVTAIMGPYDVTWVQFFAGLIQSKQADNSINLGVSQVLAVASPFTATITPAATMNTTVYACPIPGSSLFPNTNLFPC